jgi:hypothetical protein
MKKHKVQGEEAKAIEQIGHGVAASGKKHALQKAGASSAVAAPISKAEALTLVQRTVAQATSVKDLELGVFIIGQLNNQLVFWSAGDARECLNAATTILEEMKPESVTEAMLAVQMMGVHHAALAFLQAAAVSRRTSAGSDADMARAMNLMRLFIEQAEAMAKLKGKSGQQKMTVEHVHVHQGGQAVVGQVSTAPRLAGEGGNYKKGRSTP